MRDKGVSASAAMLCIGGLVAISACVDSGNKSAAAETKVKNAKVEAAATEVEEPLEPPSAPEISGSHLDGNYSGYQPRDYQPSKTAGKTVELILRSSPPGAVASIDGKAIGTTPTFWSGRVDHSSHDFTFVKAGYSMARYRFVATQNGVVHGTLVPLKHQAAPGGDAGIKAAKPADK